MKPLDISEKNVVRYASQARNEKAVGLIRLKMDTTILQPDGYSLGAAFRI